MGAVAGDIAADRFADEKREILGGVWRREGDPEEAPRPRETEGGHQLQLVQGAEEEDALGLADELRVGAELVDVEAEHGRTDRLQSEHGRQAFQAEVTVGLRAWK